MRRWVGNFLAGISLLLCLACAGVWVRSYSAKDMLARVELARFSEDSSSEDELSGDLFSWRVVDSAHGVLRYSAWGNNYRRPPWCSMRWVHGNDAKVFLSYDVDDSISEVTDFKCNRFGFVAYHEVTIEKSLTFISSGIQIPLWFPTTLFALPPAIWLYRRRRKHAPGQCPACGYDLRATPGRCPECGEGTLESK